MSTLFGNIFESQPSFTFPQPLTEKYRPRAIDSFIGLEKPRKIAAKLIANPFPSAWLFIGPSGTGKTTLAMAIAQAMPGGDSSHTITRMQCEHARTDLPYLPICPAVGLQDAYDFS